MREQRENARVLAARAIDQIRDALATLSYASDGFYEDEAQVALDALDWLEAALPLERPKPTSSSA